MSKRNDQTSCGCSDIDECQLGLDQCVANSDCINVPVTRDSRGYQCHCSTGYTYDLSSGSFTCVDIDECNNGDHNCDSSLSTASTQRPLTLALALRATKMIVMMG